MNKIWYRIAGWALIGPIILFGWCAAMSAESGTATETANDPETDTGVVIPYGIQMDHQVFVKESLVQIDGVTYRKIEYRSATYYLRFLNVGDNDPSVLCPEYAKGKKSELLVKGSLKMSRRSSLFVEGLRAECMKSPNGVVRVHLRPEIRAGLSFEISKNVGATLEIDPFSGGVGLGIGLGKEKNKRPKVNLKSGGLGVGFGSDF